MPYSAYTAAALALLIIALSANISRLRLANRISFGEGGMKELTVAVRAHGNTVEQSLIFIVLLYFIETYARIEPRSVLMMGAAFVVARIVYCGGMFLRTLLVRQVAHVATMLLQTAVVILVLRT